MPEQKFETLRDLIGSIPINEEHLAAIIALLPPKDSLFCSLMYDCVLPDTLVAQIEIKSATFDYYSVYIGEDDYPISQGISNRIESYLDSLGVSIFDLTPPFGPNNSHTLFNQQDLNVFRSNFAKSTKYLFGEDAPITTDHVSMLAIKYYKNNISPPSLRLSDVRALAGIDGTTKIGKSRARNAIVYSNTSYNISFNEYDPIEEDMIPSPYESIHRSHPWIIDNADRALVKEFLGNIIDNAGPLIKIRQPTGKRKTYTTIEKHPVNAAMLRNAINNAVTPEALYELAIQASNRNKASNSLISDCVFKNSPELVKSLMNSGFSIHVTEIESSAYVFMSHFTVNEILDIYDIDNNKMDMTPVLCRYFNSKSFRGKLDFSTEDIMTLFKKMSDHIDHTDRQTMISAANYERYDLMDQLKAAGVKFLDEDVTGEIFDYESLAERVADTGNQALKEWLIKNGEDESVIDFYEDEIINDGRESFLKIMQRGKSFSP